MPELQGGPGADSAGGGFLRTGTIILLMLAVVGSTLGSYYFLCSLFSGHGPW